VGGEEFGLIMPNTPVEAALSVGERIRCVVQERPVKLTTTELWVTLSIGIATAHSGDRDFDMLLSRADQALYKAKHNGRNRVEAEIATSRPI
jgi:diguanylate cyclase (GGDEF)-like protein